MREEKIHFIFFPNKDGDFKYICNQAVKPTLKKSTRIIKLVTCDNCLNVLMSKRLNVRGYG